MTEPAASSTPAPPLADVHREEWGRLLALLVARFGRLDLAEDALADAFESAVRTWTPETWPTNPAAWLLTAARRRALDRLRAEAVAARAAPRLAVDQEAARRAEEHLADPAAAGTAVPDERLRLVLLCAHPSLPPEQAAALSLRMVMGVATADIARLFLVPVPTMAARLTRARKRISTERFAVPDAAGLASAVAVVGDVAYLAFTAAYAPGSGSEVVLGEAAGEAVRLVRVVRQLAPEAATEADLDALLALMVLHHARRDARAGPGGDLVLLADQDRGRWRHEEIAEGLRLVTPLVGEPPTAYRLQALIAAEHVLAGRAEDTRWDRIAAWYAELETLTGSPVVRLNRAVAVAETAGPEAALALLAGVDPRRVPAHRLAATRADLLRRAGRLEEARASYAEAVARADNEAVRAHLRARQDDLGGR